MGFEALIGPVVGALAGTVFQAFMGGGKKSEAAAPPAPTAATPVPAPASAAAQAPSIGAFGAANATAAGFGPSSTQLSGVGGVDPTLLKLGKNTLLGS